MAYASEGALKLSDIDLYRLKIAVKIMIVEKLEVGSIGDISFVKSKDGNIYIKVKRNTGEVKKYRILHPEKTFKLDKQNVLKLSTAVVTPVLALSLACGISSLRENNKKNKNYVDYNKYACSYNEIDNDTNIINIGELLGNYTSEVIYPDEIDFKNVSSNIQEMAYENINTPNENVQSEIINYNYNISYTGKEFSIDKYNYVVENYKDLIEKYARMYGQDPNMLAAIIMQEGATNNYANLNSRAAYGFLQMNLNLWENHTLVSLNYETGQTDRITITQEYLNSVEHQIQVGAMMLDEYCRLSKGNPIAMIESHNKGEGAAYESASRVALDQGITTASYLLNGDPMLLTNYSRNYAGDPDYIDIILGYMQACIDNNLFNQDHIEYIYDGNYVYVSLSPQRNLTH